MFPKGEKVLGDIHGTTKSRKLCNEPFQVLRSSQLENHWVSVRMESVWMASERFDGKEAAAWHGTPHAQIHLLHPTYKPRAL